MKRALLFAVQVAILVATITWVNTAVVAFAIAGGLVIGSLLLTRYTRKGENLGTWEKWQVRYVSDKNENLDASFNHVTRVITVDDEWGMLAKREREAVLSHEAGHGHDIVHAWMALSAKLLTIAVRIAAVAFVLQGGLLRGLLTLCGVAAASFAGTLVVALVAKSNRITMPLMTALNVGTAFLAGREYALATAAIALSGVLSLAISREAERRADRHAFRRGYGTELARVLSALPDPAKLMHSWAASHPAHQERYRILAEG